MWVKTVFLTVSLFVVLLISCEGSQGPTGPKGDKGDTGDIGSAANLSLLSVTDGTPPNNAGDIYQLHWDRFSGIPLGFADGVDNAGGADYTAGEGIDISGNTISVSWGGIGSATTAARSDHAHDSRYVPTSTLSSSDGDSPNVGSNLVHWDNLTGMPTGFVDGTDDGGALADGSVTTAKLADGAVTSSKIASGAVALDLQLVTRDAVNVPPNATVDVSVNCPSGYKVISGGWERAGGSNKLFVPRSLPTNSSLTAWIFQFRNDGTSTTAVTTYIICVRITP